MLYDCAGVRGCVRLNGVCVMDVGCVWLGGICSLCE